MEEAEHCCICNMKAIYSVGSTNPHAVPLLYCEEHFPHWARILHEDSAVLDKRGMRRVVSLLENGRVRK